MAWTDTRTTVAAGVLALAAFGARLATGVDVPINWDAAQFVLGAAEFDPALHQPHPPGYPLYVLGGRLLGLLVGGPTRAYVLLSAAGGGLAVLLLFLLGRVLAGPSVGLAAAALLATSPLAWYYGSVGLPYGVELPAAAAVAWLSWRANARGDGRAAIGAAAVLALAGGVRPSAVLLLLPLWLFGLLGQRRATVAAAVGLLIGGCLLWLAPTVWLTGGVERYWTATARLARSAGGSSSALTGGLDALAWNAWFVSAGLLLGLGPGLAAAVPRLWWWLAAAARRRRLALFLGSWVAPPLAFFVLVHVGQVGYLLIVLPALCLLLAEALLALGRQLGLDHRHSGRAGWIATALAVASNLLVFLATPNALTARALAEERRFWHDVQGLRPAYPPETSVLVTAGDQAGAFRQATVQMANYPLRGVGFGDDGSAGVRFARHGGTPQLADYLAGAPADSVLSFPPNTTAVLVLDRAAAELIQQVLPLEQVAGTPERPIYAHRAPDPLPPLPLDGASRPAR